MVVAEYQSDDGTIFITLGVCAMAKKTKSKPMKEILRRLKKFQHIRVIVFEEKVILNQSIESWPLCDALISFYSEGFPLQKAIAYAELRKPYLVNDLEAQYVLMNRKKVYEILQSEGIPVPRYACVERIDPNFAVNVIEHDDTIEIDGEIFHKPFVEKPLNAEDHNIYIYFPSSAGGGSQRLFRKVGDRSSKYFQISTIRTEGSYLYEEFMPTDGTDVKVYTVADDYAHAEARKSPALDGKVERDSEGKEIRYPVILTPREKIIAKKVAKVVKQQICGFDLLRANGMSYVCDVNGFSFVKTSRKYYDDCSHVLGVLITRVIAPRLCPGIVPGNAPGTDDDIPLVPTTCGTIMELRCVIAVFRHGDRTPKQKMKMDVRDERFFALFHKYAGGRTNELKLKKPTQLQEVLDIVRDILDDIESGKSKNSELEEKKGKFEQLRYVLEMYGSFSGINRKIQLKYQPHGRQRDAKKKKHNSKSTTDDKSSGSTNLNTENSIENEKSGDSEPCLLLVVKWGGELTAAGRQQAEQLGRAFRCIYPGGDGNYGKNPGLGLLRLHSTYRHDLKIYASDEGRVQMTAAAFAKGFLALEGELPPILVQMVKSANTNGLLDNDNDCHSYQQMVKKRIKEVMSYKGTWTEEHRQALAPTGARSLLNAMDYVSNPTEACSKLYGYVQRLANRVAMLTANLRERERITLYHNESWDLLLRRWGKLVKDFKSATGEYDVSKLPDIYDNIKYDIQHNPGILIESEMLEFFSLARALADIVVPQEYGITKEEKLVISQRICTPLLRKILSDARYTDVDECTRLHAGYSKGVASPERFVRTRLYFTSESHLHSILTILQHGGLGDAMTDEQWKRAMDYVSTVPELNYLSQVVIMIYEDPTVEPKTEKKFHVELHFSPGAHALCRDLPTGSGFRPGRREHGAFFSQTSLLSSSTSLAETSFDSASEHTGGCIDPVTPHTPPPLSQLTTITPVAPSSYQGRKRVPFSPRDLHSDSTKSSVSCCHSLYIDRSLPSDLHEVGRTSEQPHTVSSTTTTKVPNRSHYEKHRKSQRVSRQTSTVYCPPENVSGLCYADVVNQDAVIGHRSRMQELWFENMRSVHRQNLHGFKRGSERSMSTGPMVEHALISPSLLQTDSNSTWHEKTLTTLCQPPQRALRSEDGHVSLPLSRPTSANFSQTHGRFTITSPLDTPTAVLKPLAYGNPQSPSWFADTIDLEDDDIQTTGEPEQVSTSHSTLDLHPPTPPCSYPSPEPASKAFKQLSVKTRHFSATTSRSSEKWRGHDGLTPSSQIISRRMSLGDQPPEFHPLQNKFSGTSAAAGEEEVVIGGSSGNLGIERGGNGEDVSGTVTQVYISLDSVKPDRAQELFNQGAPVAQWLMEYFDQIEKAKWSKPESQTDDTEGNNGGGSRKLVGYKPILSAADYLKADACAGSAVLKPNDQDSRRDSVDDDLFTKDKSNDHQQSSTADDTHTEASTSIAAISSDMQQFEVVTPGLTLPELSGPSRTRKSAPTAVCLENASKGENVSGNSSHSDVMDGMEAKELNALTYPNYQMHIDLKELHQCPLGKEACECVAEIRREPKASSHDNNTSSPYCKRRHRGLISTAVIRGSRDTYSNSVPDLIQLLNCSVAEGPSQTETPQNPAEMMVPSAPSVPEIYPLETLHNAMTLHQLESFFTGLTTHKFRWPFNKGNNGMDSDGEDRVSPAEFAAKLNAESSRAVSLSPSLSSKFQTHNLEAQVSELTRDEGQRV